MIAIVEIWFDFGDYVGFIPGLLVACLIAMVIGPDVARLLRVRPAFAVLLVVALGAVLSATMTPSRDALLGLPGKAGGCDLSRLWAAPWAEASLINESSLNVLLFIPLGVLIGLLPPSPLRLPVVVAAAILPVAIELFQFAAAPLGRACQGADVIDNLTGLIVGLVMGLAGAWIARQRRRRT